MKQEVSSKKIIVETNRALLSLKTAEMSKGPNDLRRGRNDPRGVEQNFIRIWIKTTKDGTEMTGQNDQGSNMALVCFGKSWYRLSSA